MIVAYTFPPIPYAGAFRTMRLCKGLDELGVELHVLTINQYNDIPNDYELLSHIPKSATIHRTLIIDPWRRYQVFKKKYGKIKGFRYINKAVSLILRFVTIPDHMVLWIPFAVFRGIKIIKKYNIDTIFVSSPPNSSQLIGYFLKKIRKVKWIADFRDPIYGNVAELNIIRASDFLSKIEKQFRISYERLIISNAETVIANTETHRKKMIDKFRINKFLTVRNSFDEDDFKDMEIDKYEKFTISHIGSMYGMRKADVLFKAIKKLEKRLSPEPLNLRVLFVGLNDPGLYQEITEFGVDKYVEIKEMVNHKEAIQIMLNSHLLLLIKETVEGGFDKIPCKFFEYLGAKIKILCLSSRKSEVAEIINDLDVGYVIEGDISEMCNKLEKEYLAFLHGEISRINCTKISNYNSRNMSKIICDLIIER